MNGAYESSRYYIVPGRALPQCVIGRVRVHAPASVGPGPRQGAQSEEGRVARLTDQQIVEALAGLPGWQRHGETLQKTFTFASFPDAIAFLLRIAFEAEASDHHPDVSIHYRQLTLSYWTHTDGGLTSKDIDGAKMADRLAAAWQAGAC